MNADAATMLAALVLMGASVAAKIATLRLVHGMREAISQEQYRRREAGNQLRMVQAQHATATRSKAALERKAGKLQRRLRQLKREIYAMDAETQRRERKSQDMRRSLMRPPVSA